MDSGLDIAWLLICAAMVMLMQAGFCCLESGLVRTRNSINVATKNLVDFFASSAIFWLFGFALMFGASAGGWFCRSEFMFGPTARHWLAGPGAIAAIILFCNGASQASDQLTLAAVIEVMSGIVYATLRATVHVARLCGDLGLTVISRLPGMIIVAIPIDMTTIGVGLRFLQLNG